MSIVLQGLAIATMAATSLFPLSVRSAAEPLTDKTQISIQSRVQENVPEIVITSRFDFGKPLSLKIKTDPAFDVSDALIQLVQKLDIRDAQGVLITSGFDIAPDHRLVIGYSGGTSEIISVTPTPNGLRVVGSFKDKAGNFVSPPAGRLAAYTTYGEKLCFSYETVAQAAPRMAFTLLLDRSGSMGGSIEAVKQAARSFLRLLPGSAECAVANFNSSWTYGHSHYQSCHRNDFGFESIEADGGTEIYAPLKDAYLTLSRPYFDAAQKAVIIISDGYTVIDAQRKQELMALKKDTLTFVYLIGSSKKDELEGVTDHFIAEGGDLHQSLSRYFDLLGQAYRTQKVLNVKPCNGGSHASP